MQSIKVGYLFKKIKLNYNNKEIEVIEYLDYVAAIKYCNRDNNILYNIINGKYKDTYATNVSKNDLELEYILKEDDLDQAIRDNDSRVDFSEIRANRINNPRYYIRENGRINLLKDKEIISLLEYSNKDYDEKELNITSDISKMYNEIRKTIISQDEQIMEILTTLYKNQTVVKSNLDKDLIAKLKENILIYGETGTGKTEILKRISSIYNIPIVIEDATMLSETGYQGRKITDVLEDLYNASNNNRELAEKSILVIDEFDKLAEKDNESHVSRIGVQRSLLKLLDGSVFYFNNKVFDTSKLTIVAIGAFTDIKDNYKNITTDDLIKYGIIRELVARFSKTIAMNKLTKEDIIKIIKESNFSPINTYKELFKLLNVEFNYTDEYIDYIADIASNKNTGARSIKTIFDNSISSALFRIFQGEYESITLDKPNTNEKAYTLVKKK